MGLFSRLVRLDIRVEGFDFAGGVFGSHEVVETVDDVLGQRIACLRSGGQCLAIAAHVQQVCGQVVEVWCDCGDIWI